MRYYAVNKVQNEFVVSWKYCKEELPFKHIIIIFFLIVEMKYQIMALKL